MVKSYQHYYVNQCGGGSLYISPHIVQQGRGIGNFFSGIKKLIT